MKKKFQNTPMILIATLSLFVYSFSWASQDYIENACNPFPKDYDYRLLQSKKLDPRFPAADSGPALGSNPIEQQSTKPIRSKDLANLINSKTLKGKKLIDLDGDGKFDATTYQKRPGTYVLEIDLANTGKPNYFHEYNTDGAKLSSHTWSVDSKTGSKIYEENCKLNTCERKSRPNKTGRFTKLESQTKTYIKKTGMIKIASEVRTWNDSKRRFDIAKSTKEVSAIQNFVDAEQAIWFGMGQPGNIDRLSYYNKIKYGSQTTQGKAICLDCYGGDLKLDAVGKLLSQSLKKRDDEITLSKLPVYVFSGSRFYYLNGIYIDEYSCKGLSGKELQLINNDIYEKMKCMLKGAKQLEETGPAENAIVMKEHLRRLLMTLALKDEHNQPLLGKIKKGQDECDDPDNNCIEYKEMDGPSFTCYTAIRGRYDWWTEKYYQAGVMYATASSTYGNSYREKESDKIRRVFYHPHINYNQADQLAGKRGQYGKDGGKKKIVDLNLPVFHELMHNSGYFHDDGQCEYAYPCGDLCGRDMQVDQDFLRLCSHPPSKKMDPDYIEDIKAYFGDYLWRNSQPLSEGANGESGKKK